jgi:hypothetical protein
VAFEKKRVTATSNKATTARFLIRLLEAKLLIQKARARNGGRQPLF